MNALRPSILLLLLVAGAGLTSSGCGSKAASTEEPPPAATSELPADVAGVAAELEKASGEEPTTAGAAAAERAARGPVTAPGSITASGEFISPVRSELVVRTPGRVAAIHADEGDRVRRGQPLLTLETQYLKPEVERAEAELSRARAALDEARSDFERKQQLLAKDAIPQSLYDRSKGSHDQAQAAVSATEAAVALARQKLDDAVLTSPIDGVVAERRADVGERLGDNTVAYVLVQLSPLKLRFELPERYLPQVRKGSSVVAQVDPFPGEVFSGRVAMVGSVIDAESRAFPVEAEFANRDARLRPGLFARVELAAPAPAGASPGAASPGPRGEGEGGRP